MNTHQSEESKDTNFTASKASWQEYTHMLNFKVGEAQRSIIEIMV
jgi:hypothetical protein